jgi:hypothetical protein
MNVRDHSGRAREDMVVARLHELAPALDGEPDPAFRATTRARLVAMAAVRTPEPEPVTGVRRLLAARDSDAVPSWRRRLTAGLAGAAMSVTALAALVAVSTDARPGDALYAIKRGTEQTSLALAGDARGETLLDLASTRLDELAELGGADPALLLDTLRTMDDQTTEGAAWLTARAVSTEDAGPLETLENWTTGQADGLSALAPRLPDETADAAQASLGLLSDVAVRLDGLQSALDCAGGPAVEGADDLGPVPGACTSQEVVTPPGGGPGGAPSPDSAPGGPAPADPSGTTSDPAPVPGGPAVPGGPTAGGGSDGGSESGSGGGLEVPPTGVPREPSLPLPSVPLVLPLPSVEVPPLPLPSTPTLPGQGGQPPSGPPVVDVPLGDGDVGLCLPPLATLGDC